LIVVVADAAVAAANAAAGKVGGGAPFGPPDGVPWSPDGKEPGTHWVCSWKMKPAEEATLRAELQPLVDAAQCWIHDGLIETPAGDRSRSIRPSTRRRQGRLGAGTGDQGGNSGPATGEDR